MCILSLNASSLLECFFKPKGRAWAAGVGSVASSSKVKIVKPKKISNQKLGVTESFLIQNLFKFLISTTFWKNDCSAIYDQTAPKLFSLVVNSVMSTLHRYQKCVRLVGKVFDLFQSTVIRDHSKKCGISRERGKGRGES